LKTLLASKQFIPHGHCYLWNQKLVGLHIVSDCLIAVAYFSISITLFYFVQKRQDFPFNWMFLLFGLFITSCGTTHLMEIWTLWHPIYWLSGCIKAITALISLYTAFKMISLVPKALALPSPAQLELANQELECEIIERQRMEKALLESQAKYKTLFEIFPIGISITDQAGKVIEANPASQKLLEISTADHTTRKYDDPEWVCIRPDGTPMPVEEFASVRALTENRVVENVEKGILKADGKITWISVTAAPVPLPEYGVAIAYIDITDRQLAEAALRRFRAIFNQTFQFVGLLQPDGIILEANQTILDFAGLSHSQVIGKPFWETRWWTISTETQERLKAAIARAATGEFVRYEVDVLGKGDVVATIDFSLRPIQDESGQVKLLIPEGRDITERKQMEGQLRNSQYFLQKVANTIPQILYLLDISKEFTLYLNQQTTTMLGYSPKEIYLKEPQWLEEQLHPDDQHLYYNMPSRSINLSDNEVLSIDYRFRHKNGKWRWLNARRVVFARDAHGIPTKILGLVEDITESKQTEVHLQEALTAAKAASIAKSRFLSNMSHELRTPLNIILGFCQVIDRSNSLSSDQKEQLEIINRSGEHLLDLINDILSMSKIEAGQVILNENCFDLYQILGELELMLSLKAAVQSLKLIFYRAADVPQYVQTDESKLRQVLINLLENAIKFTKSGSVTLRVRLATGDSQSRQSDESRYNKEESTPVAQFPITFEVEDTGSGVAPHEIDTLFDLFVQTETGRQSMQGTGLGLPISREFVRLMGGDIIVNSEIDRGTRFTFDVLVRETAPVDKKTSLTTKRVIGLEPNQPIYRILVVEDLKENRLLMVKLLEPLGFQVREAVNGTEAISLWSTWEPHLIFMDMRMPVMDGYEATRQIKATLKGQTTVIIALTASAFDEERAKVLSAGCDDFVRKPFRESVLFDKMAEYLGVRYLYEDENQITSQLTATIPKKLIPDDLSVMPPEWVAQLHEAVLCANDELILQMIAQIPETEANLAHSLTDLVNSFRLDLLFDLTDASTNE